MPLDSVHFSHLKFVGIFIQLKSIEIEASH